MNLSLVLNELCINRGGVMGAERRNLGEGRGFDFLVEGGERRGWGEEPEPSA